MFSIYFIIVDGIYILLNNDKSICDYPISNRVIVEKSFASCTSSESFVVICFSVVHLFHIHPITVPIATVIDVYATDAMLTKSEKSNSVTGTDGIFKNIIFQPKVLSLSYVYNFPSALRASIACCLIFS